MILENEYNNDQATNLKINKIDNFAAINVKHEFRSKSEHHVIKINFYLFKIIHDFKIEIKKAIILEIINQFDKNVILIENNEIILKAIEQNDLKIHLINIYTIILDYKIVQKEVIKNNINE